MNFSSISTARSAAVALVVSGIAFFGISGMAYAQGNNTSGQSGYKKEDPGDYSDKNDPIQGHTGEPNNGKANFQEFHTVYIDPESWEHWKKTGKFRDGTILIKEMTSVGNVQKS